MGKRLSLKEINAARHEQEVFNSLVKRGEVNTATYVRTGYCVCGCGRESCGFITRWVKDGHYVVDLAEQHTTYQAYLKKHSSS